MKYMLMFWVDESAEVTGDEDAATLIAVKSWVEKMAEQGVRRHGGALRSVREGRIVRIRTMSSWCPTGRSPKPRNRSAATT